MALNRMTLNRMTLNKMTIKNVIPSRRTLYIITVVIMTLSRKNYTTE
jgi:hypothetical protein